MSDIQGLSILSLSVPAAQGSTVTGSAVAIKNYEGDVGFIQDTAAGTGSAPTLNGKIQDSADGSTGWADVTGATFTEVTDAADSSQIIKVPANKMKGFVRYIGTIAGGTPSFTVGVAMIGQKKIV